MRGLGVLLVVVVSCTDASKDAPFPFAPHPDAAALPDAASSDGAACPPGAKTVKLSTDLRPLIEESCGCHTSTVPPNDFALKEDVAYLNLLKPVMECPGMNRVVPGQPDQSYIIHKLTGHNPNGMPLCFGVQMPKGDTPFTQAKLDLFRTWISEGACNN